MLRLLLPALIPSWRFFDTIGPSPRIQFALLAQLNDAPAHWREFRPRPAHLSFSVMLRRLFWNPRWNESLYMTSCAEIIIDEPSALRVDELLSRIANAIGNGEIANELPRPAFLIVRIVVLRRELGQIAQQVMFTSTPRRLDDANARNSA